MFRIETTPASRRGDGFMPTDLQLIDGFEGLRAQFAQANPDAPLAPAEGADPPEARARHSLETALAAWLCAAADLNGGTGQQERRLRRLLRAAQRGETDAAAVAGDDPGLARLLRGRGGLLESARDCAARLRDMADPDGAVGLEEAVPTAAAEARAWAALLPGLRGLRAWRMLQRLGRPVVVPDLPVRRFLWRLGLLEDENPRSNRNGARVADEIDRLAQLTGFDGRALDALIAWHTRAVPGLREGGRCAARADCPGCPLAAGCAWRRYGRAQQGDASTAALSGDSTAKLHRRWEELGPEKLDDRELLALLLPGGSGRDPVEKAERLLRRAGGLRGLELASAAELSAVKDIGDAQARRIKAALELGRRLSLNPLRRGDPVAGSRDVWEAYRERYRHIGQEHFIVLQLDSKNRLIESHIVSKGTLNSSPAHPREVFKQAIRNSASAIIVMHNHPSGDPEPSSDDIAITHKLAEAGRILGIRVLDHIILGNETYYSFKDEGHL